MNLETIGTVLAWATFASATVCGYLLNISKFAERHVYEARWIVFLRALGMFIFPLGAVIGYF